MDWVNERYVRLYVRDTTTWQLLSWQARALLLMAIRKADRAGVIDVGRHGARGLAALVGMPADVVIAALPELVCEDGPMEEKSGSFVFPNFIEAQEASMSANARQRESRLRRRDHIRTGIDPSQRSTVLYFIQSEHGGPIKIGHAEDLAKRLVNLQTSRPDKLVILASIPATVEQERQIHSLFAHIREKGEWFTATDELVSVVRSLVTGAVTLSGLLADGVTSHETKPVTPYRAVPSLAVLSSGAPPPNPLSPETPPSSASSLPQTRAHVGEGPRPAGWAQLGAKKRAALARHLPAAERLWELQAELRREGSDSTRALAPTAERLARVAERLESGMTEAEAEAALRHYAAEAAKTGDWSWLNGETNWRAANCDRALGMAGAARASPRRSGGGLTPQEILDMDMSESPFRQLKGGGE